MATLTITIPDDQVTRVNAAFAAEFGYPTSSPLTPSQFTKFQIIQFAKKVVYAHEIKAAEKTAREAAHNASEPNLS